MAVWMESEFALSGTGEMGGGLKAMQNPKGGYE